MADNAPEASPQPAAAPTAPAPAVPAAAAAVAESVAPAQPKLKVSKPRQRSCDEKDAKGKLCAGHLKHWYDYPKEIEALVGAGSEIYRCEFCKTLYRPDPKQLPHSYTLRY